MKRLLALALTAAAAASPAYADWDGQPFEVTGRIVYANPATKQASGITERANPCGTTSARLGDMNGLDGFWIELPSGIQGRSATMASDALDADVWYYRLTDLGCELVGATADPHWADMATLATPHEAGIVPATATHAIVDLVAGQGSTFVLQIT